MRLPLVVMAVVLLSSCSSGIRRAPGINILEQRADYKGDRDVETAVRAIGEGGSSLFVPQKTKPRVVDIYIHPHETAHGDYFRGGFIRSIVQGSQWELTKAATTPGNGVVREQVRESSGKEARRQAPKEKVTGRGKGERGGRRRKRRKKKTGARKGERHHSF